MRAFGIILLIFLQSFETFAQENLEIESKRILAEGNELYQNIRKADLLLNFYRQTIQPRKKIGSLTYSQNGKETGIVFQLHSDSASVLMSAEFQNDSITNVDTLWRLQTENENVLADIYKNSYASGGLWSKWSGISDIDFWIVIKNSESGYVSYVLTKSLDETILPIGNDFKLNYNSKGKYKDFKAIHNNYIPISDNPTTDTNNMKGDFHTHLNSTVAKDYMTPTDICIYKLYADKLKFKRHFVGSKKYISEYNSETGELIILTKEEFQRKEGIEKLKY